MVPKKSGPRINKKIPSKLSREYVFDIFLVTLRILLPTKRTIWSNSWIYVKLTMNFGIFADSKLQLTKFYKLLVKRVLEPSIGEQSFSFWVLKIKLVQLTKANCVWYSISHCVKSVRIRSYSGPYSVWMR